MLMSLIAKTKTRMFKKKLKKQAALHARDLGGPIVIGIAILILAIFIPPAPAAPHTSNKITDTATKTPLARAIPTPPKPSPPPPPTPAPPPKAKTTPVATSVAVHGTPKAEPVVTPSPSSSVSGLAPTTNPTPSSPSTGSSAAPQTTTGYTSTNWSGYIAVNGTFTGVSGSWVATNPTGNNATTTADSTWIGIGGVTSGDLIQVGTQNIINSSGIVTTSAFYELLPDFSQPVPGITVTPGDSMSASITQISSGQWSITITDNTNGQVYTNTFAYNSTLSSAEWIEEDPSFSAHRQIPFDNFGIATFSGSSTVMNGSSISLASSTAQPVTMVNRSGTPIAVPSAISGSGSFTVSP